jgi:hypothetical protein
VSEEVIRIKAGINKDSDDTYKYLIYSNEPHFQVGLISNNIAVKNIQEHNRPVVIVNSRRAKSAFKWEHIEGMCYKRLGISRVAE